MKITDSHVTRIELTSDEVGSVLNAMADRLYREGVIPLPTAMTAPAALVSPPPPWASVTPISAREWKFQTETVHSEDGGAVITIRRSR